MYSIVILSYSDYCFVLMLNTYMYEYYAWHIYVVVAFSYLVQWGITDWYQSPVLPPSTHQLTN